VKLETEVDDCTGEALGNALSKLFSPARARPTTCPYT
jgi:uncharacterized protein (DUF111 family)